jgi:hypothetical protein
MCAVSATNADARYLTGRVTFDILPDDVLLDIFDFYRMDPTFYQWMWVTLAHVCPRWRQVVFASPRRLDLQFLCTPRTRVRELLDFLPPAMPIMISNSFDSPTPHLTLSLEDGSQVIAAIEHRDRVWWIHLQDLPSALLQKLATKMQETCPTLKYLRLWADDEAQAQAAPVLPEGFLGGSAPCLETFWLRGIPFPELSKLLLSTNDLVQFVLEKIPDSGYISPEAMTAALSTCTKLEMLIIEFLSEDPHPDGPDPTSQGITTITRVSLPALTYFNFNGSGSYFDNFVPRIESPLLARDSNPFWQHDTSVIRHVQYEASFTQTRFSSLYSSRPLIIPVLEDE